MGQGASEVVIGMSLPLGGGRTDRWRGRGEFEQLGLWMETKENNREKHKT